MPMFGFQCPQCHAFFEEWVRSTSAIEDVACPECGNTRVKKQLSRVARLQTSSSSSSFTSISNNCAPGGT